MTETIFFEAGFLDFPADGNGRGATDRERPNSFLPAAKDAAAGENAAEDAMADCGGGAEVMPR